MPDSFLDEQVRRLEQLCAGRDPTSPEVRRANTVLLRVRHAQRNGYLARAPRLRRYVLGDIRIAQRALERNP